MFIPIYSVTDVQLKAKSESIGWPRVYVENLKANYDLTEKYTSDGRTKYIHSNANK